MTERTSDLGEGLVVPALQGHEIGARFERCRRSEERSGRATTLMRLPGECHEQADRARTVAPRRDPDDEYAGARAPAARGRARGQRGRQREDETMIYVHVAENHRRELPQAVIEASLGEVDPDRRVLKMLGARGKNMAKTEAGRDENSMILVG
jgi:hypothetical protein